ncbi:hypothetical protein LXL04_008537 [Taraxacum kok-saghyz]
MPIGLLGGLSKVSDESNHIPATMSEAAKRTPVYKNILRLILLIIKEIQSLKVIEEAVCPVLISVGGDTANDQRRLIVAIGGKELDEYDSHTVVKRSTAKVGFPDLLELPEINENLIELIEGEASPNRIFFNIVDATQIGPTDSTVFCKAQDPKCEYTITVITRCIENIDIWSKVLKLSEAGVRVICLMDRGEEGSYEEVSIKDEEDFFGKKLSVIPTYMVGMKSLYKAMEKTFGRIKVPGIMDQLSKAIEEIREKQDSISKENFIQICMEIKDLYFGMISKGDMCVFRGVGQKWQDDLKNEEWKWEEGAIKASSIHGSRPPPLLLGAGVRTYTLDHVLAPTKPHLLTLAAGKKRMPEESLVAGKGCAQPE